jgi:hypothetical protein
MEMNRTKKWLEKELKVTGEWLEEETKKSKQIAKELEIAIKRLENVHNLLNGAYNDLKFFKELSVNLSKALASVTDKGTR